MRLLTGQHTRLLCGMRPVALQPHLFFRIFCGDALALRSQSLRPCVLLCSLSTIRVKGGLTNTEVLQIAKEMFQGHLWHGRPACFDQRWWAAVVERHPASGLRYKLQRVTECTGQEPGMTLVRSEKLNSDFELMVKSIPGLTDERVSGACACAA